MNTAKSVFGSESHNGFFRNLSSSGSVRGLLGNRRGFTCLGANRLHHLIKGAYLLKRSTLIEKLGNKHELSQARRRDPQRFPCRRESGHQKCHTPRYPKSQASPQCLFLLRYQESWKETPQEEAPPLRLHACIAHFSAWSRRYARRGRTC